MKTRALILGAISIVLLLAPAGCKRNRDRPPPVSATPALSPLEVADRHYGMGEYAEAEAAYRSLLEQSPSSAERQHVVFRLAMAQLLQDPGAEGQNRALELLRAHAASGEAAEPAASEATVLLELLEGLQQARSDLRDSRRQAQRLASELEKLREIDLRRRPP